MTDTFGVQGDAFWKWLSDNGVGLSDGIAFKDYRCDQAGRGVVATRLIKDGETLFSLPRKVLFSTKTAALAKQPGFDAILQSLQGGWTALILCMMYELDRADSFWKPYFDVLPREFSTPMFWDDWSSLQGTGIMNKIGKEEADQCYDEQILPIIQAHPDLFDTAVHTKHLFHVCGSLIMAYSFHEEVPADETSKKEGNGAHDDSLDDSEEDEEEEDEDQGLIAMVPMADMLNHKTGYNNARLFHEPEQLVMKAIKDIASGDQIYNTYGDLCNADLLRKYGFTDDPNPFDLVEIDGQDVMTLACPADHDDEIKEEKLGYLMEEGVMDDCFVIDGDHEIPPELVASVIVFSSPVETFKKWASKGKVPSPKLTEPVQQVLLKILGARLEKYTCSLQADLEQGMTSALDENEKNALRVRIGEKKILETTINKLRQLDISDKKRSSSYNGTEQQPKKQRSK
ncbi:hypothetical protein BC940DRAFT_309610 [Gongronella butleri]|nr:hypothetical protein BC940DRAFT_309610 [Gongronella butleri]